jgi:cellulose synthase/poly-beta-1,6-N-acetylglucosamine synthase-like glycosyltransferase
MYQWDSLSSLIVMAIFVMTQAIYFLVLAVDAYLFSLPVNWVDTEAASRIPDNDLPYIVMFYPVLRESESVMRTTMLAVADIDYPASRFRVVAIPNWDDHATIKSLRRLRRSFRFLHILVVPPTVQPGWQSVWESWERNPKAYWWHNGNRAGDRNLPPKKTRQLIYGFYKMADGFGAESDFIVSYIDADSAPPRRHFRDGAGGMRQYDVLQATNVAGNLNDSMAASWHAFDHMAWDGFKYKHLSANGRQPYWMLGKGLFFRASDLMALGGFNPWVTIEDPEVGMRFWVNGKRLGIIAAPLIEEVPSTLADGFLQRSRWVCGFFQSLGRPLKAMGMTPWQRFKARLNFVPCLFLAANAVGLPFGVWLAWRYIDGRGVLPDWCIPIASASVAVSAFSMLMHYIFVWKRTALVLDGKKQRLWFMLRVNPLSLLLWWTLWIVPILRGLHMHLSDGGLVWQRTDKSDANHELVRAQLAGPVATAVFVPAPAAGNDRPGATAPVWQPTSQPQGM